VFPQGLKPAFLLALDGVAQGTPASQMRTCWGPREATLFQSTIFETSSSHLLIRPFIFIATHGFSGAAAPHFVVADANFSNVVPQKNS
jgi:hypothetical protein